MLCDGCESHIHHILLKIIYLDRSLKELSCYIWSICLQRVVLTNIWSKRLKNCHLLHVTLLQLKCILSNVLHKETIVQILKMLAL